MNHFFNTPPWHVRGAHMQDIKVLVKSHEGIIKYNTTRNELSTKGKVSQVYYSPNQESIMSSGNTPDTLAADKDYQKYFDPSSYLKKYVFKPESMVITDEALSLTLHGLWRDVFSSGQYNFSLHFYSADFSNDNLKKYFARF